MSISVIVAAKNAANSIRANLKAILQQLNPGDELLLIDASADTTAEIVQKEFPQVTLIKNPPTLLIPELWSIGLKQATGDILVITTAHCVPEDAWLAIARAALVEYAAVGGAIKNSAEASLVDSAIYYCRYWRYMLPFQKYETADLPGDNTAYRRKELFALEKDFATAFWEPFINIKIWRETKKMAMLPELVVCHHHSFTIGAFIENRLRHGYNFGKDRAKELTRIQRVGYLLASPLIPLIFLKRIFTASQPSERQKLLYTLPVLVLFLVAWALGEASAYGRSVSS